MSALAGLSNQAFERNCSGLILRTGFFPGVLLVGVLAIPSFPLMARRHSRRFGIVFKSI